MKNKSEWKHILNDRDSRSIFLQRLIQISYVLNIIAFFFGWNTAPLYFPTALLANQLMIVAHEGNKIVAFFAYMALLIIVLLMLYIVFRDSKHNRCNQWIDIIISLSFAVDFVLCFIVRSVDPQLWLIMIKWNPFVAGLIDFLFFLYYINLSIKKENSGE